MVYSPKSYCHDAPVYTGSADEGTSYYVCTYCGLACDARLLENGKKTNRFPWFAALIVLTAIAAFLLLSAPSVGKVPDRPLESVPTVISPSLGSNGGVETLPQPSIAPTWRTVTAYTSDEEQTDSTPCLSADGSNICARYEDGETLCAANFVPFGTLLMLDNSDVPDGEDAIVCVVADRLSSRYPNRVDIYMGMDTERAIEFGVRTMYVSELTIE